MESSSEVQSWLDQISSYEREFKKWEGRVTKIIKRYRDEDRKTSDNSSKFNILWSNVQTLTAATFAKVPKPDVTRRFKDNDQVGRVAALILERGLDYEIQKYTDYTTTLRQSIYDRFLGGRGTAWVRYEPHFKAAEQNLPTDGDQISEDVDLPGEQLDYECVPTDYVHWKDFGHTVARTWEEVTAVWRVVYLTREQCIERFGEEVGSKIPLDSKPEDSSDKQSKSDEKKSRAKIYEIWNKTDKTALWIAKSGGKLLDKKPDPLGLEEFWPCPRPLFATLTNDSLVPVPDFSLYQDQANELDIIADRIDGLIKALKVSGVYDAQYKEIGRLFTEAENGTLIPVKNWNAFAEKQGLKGAIDVVDLTPIAAALREAYGAMEQVKAQVYEITGISDIIRGQTEASETATAQQIKGQYASLRLKSYQEEVSRFATEILQIKAQIMCAKFTPQTLLSISAADQLSEADKQLVPQALALLIGQERSQDPTANPGPNPLRAFRIDISADSLVYLDEQEEKQSRLEFLNATGGFLDKAMMAAQQMPQSAPLFMEMLMFGIRGFKIGKSIEGVFDQTLEQMKQMAQQPQDKPDPEMEKVKAQQQADQARLQHEMQVKEAELQFESQKLQLEQQNREAEQQNQLAIEQQRNQLEHERELTKLQLEAEARAREMDFERWKAELEARNKIEIAEISAKATLDSAQITAAKRAESASANV
jgi:hypothetical protein